MSEQRANSGGPRPERAFLDPHKAGLKSIQRYLQTAVDKAFVPTHPAEYTAVTVVLLHFDNDDLGIGDLERELGVVFRDWYGFRVQHHRLPSSGNPRLILTNILLKLINEGFADQGNLVVLVFSGHAQIKQETIGQNSRKVEKLHVGGRVWNGMLTGNTLKWNDVVEVFEGCEADVLHIMDCCYAAEAAIPYAEMLAATSATEMASSDIATSFTRALIEQLKRFSSSGTSVANLFSHMMAERKALKLTYTPVYDPRPGEKPSIFLKPKGSSVKKNVITQATGKSPRILLTAHLEASLNPGDVNELEKWMTTFIPKTVQNVQVKLEGFFDADSGVMLFTVPIDIWSQLEPSGAFTYVGVVHSRNRLLRPPIALPVLGSRPVAATGENIRPSDETTK
ncbi:hypothetical protein EKO04_007111 [Ascochyta lentis]|uniref:Uncharacterized protein n=1 Tax=Ascochyta lentis TaxID=205686 RepID=A0A8H7IZR6_9PLEO|nr:hypothetical protein EKO04_007111 [Ascochyta lentis]